MTEHSEKLTILMLSTDPRVLGGITSFTAMLMAHAGHCRFIFVPVGSVQHQAGKKLRREWSIARAWRLISVPVKIALKAIHADVVHLNTPFNTRGLIRDWLILLALRIAGYRQILVYIHGWQPRVAHRIVRSRILREMIAFLLNGVSHIMVLAPEFKASLVAMGVAAERITVTRTMFDGTYLREAPPLPVDRRRRILFMSRFVREKGIYELLEAFARIAPDYPDVHLILAGDGPEYAALRTAANAQSVLTGRVQFPGYVGGQEKAALLQSCDIFTLPTYYPEGMPVALLEAMGAGKPLLTSKAGGIPHIISQPEQGLLLDEITAGNLESALRQMLDDPDGCRRTGARNYTYAWERFEASVVTAEIEACYQMIAKR